MLLKRPKVIWFAVLVPVLINILWIDVCHDVLRGALLMAVQLSALVAFLAACDAPRIRRVVSALCRRA